MKISMRAKAIETSKTSHFLSLIKKMRKNGREIINLAIGEPSFEPHSKILEATKNAIDQKKFRYDTTSGLLALKRRLALQYDSGIDEKNILITNGAKQGLYSLFQVICDPLDEVILPNPSWVSFSQQIAVTGAIPVIVEMKNSHLDIDNISHAITENTKAILINSPNNPTGAVYPKENLIRIGELAKDNDIFLISDEAYGAFVYEKENDFLLSDISSIRDRLVVVRSFSKEYAMTGFRVGYVVGPEEVIGFMKRLQGHLCGNVCTFAQFGALAALDTPRSVISGVREDLKQKRDYAYSVLKDVFECILPEGGFYIFPNIKKVLKQGMGSRDFAAHMLEKTGVAVIPGIEFGCEGHIRISFAVPMDQLKEGLHKLKEAL